MQDLTGRPYRWMQPDEHPFPFALLDMRAFAVGARSTPQEQAVRDGFAARREAAAPAWDVAREVRVPGELTYPAPEGIPAGVLFRAVSFEEKWDLFREGGRLLAVRSWTGEPVFSARLELEGDDAALFDVRCRDDQDPGMALRHLDFLVWTVLYGRPVPHPVPEGMLADPELTVRWSFGMHGRFACFAAEGDATRWVREEIRGNL